MSTPSSATKELKEKLHPVFTSIAYTTFLVIIIYISVFFAWCYEATPGVQPVRWFIPYICIFLILELLGKLSPRFRLNPGQLIALLIPLTYASGHRFIYMGAWGTLAYWHNILDFWLYNVVGQLHSEVVKNAIRTLPSWLVPHSDLAINVIYHGLQVGQSIPWDIWIGPVVTWSLTFISMNILNIGIGFLLTGPQFTEERLLFPLSVPAIYSINQFTTRDERGKSKLFSKENKLFWGFFAIGFILGFPNFISEVVPFLKPLGILPYGDIDLPILRTLNPLLPGADFRQIFIPPLAILSVLLPYSTLITGILTVSLLNFLLDPLMVKLGVVPYSPGAGPKTYGTDLPIPYYILACVGMVPAYGIWLIWLMRRQVKAIWKSLIRKEDLYIGDLPVRKAAWITIASLLLLLGIWVAAGMPIIIGLILVVLYLLYQIALARLHNEIWLMHCPSATEGLWLLYYPVGGALGYWNWTPPNINCQTVASGVFFDITLSRGGNAWSARTMMTAPFTTLFYQMTRELKASVKQVYSWYILVAILGIPAAIVLRLFMEAHLGAKNLVYGALRVPQGLSYDVLGFFKPYPHYKDWTMNYLLVFLSMIFMWILIYLRNFSWFSWFNPSAFILGIVMPEYILLNFIVALIIKYVTYKVFGPRRTEENIVPAVSGFCLGNGIEVLFHGLYDFFVATLPTILTFWR